MPLHPFDRACLRLGRAGVLCLVAGGLLLAVEGVARLLYDPPPVRRVYDPFAYRIPQPLLQEQFPGVDGDPVDIRLNELGMRGPSLADPIPPQTLTLVFLGGSTTENYHLPREATFPELIGRRLETRLGRPVRVLNGGMSAATTATSLARLQHQVLDLEPSLVVVLHAINDLIAGYAPGYRPDGRHLARPPLAGTRPRSVLYAWFRHRLAGVEKEEAGRVSLAELRSLPAFDRNLRSMVAVAHAHRVPILLLTQAHRYRDDPGPDEIRDLKMTRRLDWGGATPPDFASLARGMDSFNATTLSRSTDPGATVFDLAGRLPTSPELIFDDCHLTRAGNLAVAELLVPQVETLVPEP